MTRAFHTWLDDLDKGRFADSWEGLVAAQQSVVARSAYAGCQRDLLQEGGYDSISYIRTISDRTTSVDVASATLSARVVTAKIRLNGRDPVTTMLTLTWVAESGRWRLLLAPADVAAYRRDRCPQHL